MSESTSKRSKRKLLIQLGIAALFLVMAATASVFLLASTVPEDYRPYQLNPDERKMVAESFYTEEFFPFMNEFGEPEPFVHEIREDRLNQYLAALDEIAYIKPDRAGEVRKTGGVYEAMDQAGLADPVVKMRDGVLTVMVRTRRSNKIFAADLTFTVLPDTRLHVRLQGVRLGRLPVPQGFVDQGVAMLKSEFAKRAAAMREERGLNALLAVIIGAINEDPIDTTLKIRRQTKRTHRVELSDGLLKLHIVPVDEE